MRLTKLVRTLAHIGAMSGALLLCSAANGQELLPSVSFSASSGSWSSDANWTLDGSEPPQDGSPLESEIAVIGSGVANVDSAAGPVHSLSISRGTLNLASGGALTVENQAIVGSAGTLVLGGGSLSAGSLAVLGTIDLPADADLAFGSTYPVATSGSVAGSPKSITVGGRRASLPTGLGLGMVATADGAAVVVESLPILEVSRETGAAAIKNMVGGPIDVSGYSIESAGALIKRTGGSWNSLEDQGIAGWEEANPTRTTRFSELNLLSSSTLGVGDSWAIGNIYTGIGEPPAKEDLKFEVMLADGRVLSTAVQYTGPPNDLFLAIDPATGEGSINHISPLIDPFDVTAISVLSASGSLNSPTESLLGDGWNNANPQPTGYTEVNLEGSRVFSQGDSVSLGAIWDTGGAQDLTFTFATTDGALRTGSVVFGAAPTGPVCNPNTGGDLDGNGRIEFADFLTISNNFGTAVSDHTQGDIDCDGMVAFSDFLVLSNAFGTTVGAETASVPEPTSGLLFFLGFLGMLKFRKRAARVAVVAVAVTICCASSQDAMAQFDTEFFRVHPAGPNNGIGSLTEALGIRNGTVVDAILNESLTGELEGAVDLGGGVGTFDFAQQPYLNGVEDDSMANFAQFVSGTVEIPAGQYTIGCGSDDGCMVSFSNPEVTFDDRYNENANNLGASTIFYNAGRGHDWTFGTLTIPAGGVTTGILMGFNEGGGGDSFEVAIFEEHIAEAEAGPDAAGRALTAGLFVELADGELGWEVTGDPYVSIAGDFNADGIVDAADAEILVENFGDEGGFAQGDINFDGDINMHDASLFRPLYAAATAGGEASVVPEPGSVSLLLVGFAALLGFRRRKRA